MSMPFKTTCLPKLFPSDCITPWTEGEVGEEGIADADRADMYATEDIQTHGI